MTTMVSIRVPDDEAEALQREASRSNVSVSELVRAGVRAILARATAEREAELYERLPLTATELLDPADQVWLADEDWTAWEQR